MGMGMGMGSLQVQCLMDGYRGLRTLAFRVGGTAHGPVLRFVSQMQACNDACEDRELETCFPCHAMVRVCPPASDTDVDVLVKELLAFLEKAGFYRQRTDEIDVLFVLEEDPHRCPQWQGMEFRERCHFVSELMQTYGEEEQGRVGTLLRSSPSLHKRLLQGGRADALCHVSVPMGAFLVPLLWLDRCALSSLFSALLLSCGSPD